MSRALHLGLALALLSGCGLSRERNRRDDGGVDATVAPDDAETDAFVPEDSGADAGVDAFVPDAFVPEPDGGPACECVATSECESAACVDGVCVRGPVSDGAECGEVVMGAPSGVCVAGGCVARGCGDGFVEPGPSDDAPDAPAREACDDGNLLDGDACSASCTPTSFVVDRAPDLEYAPALESGQPRALAVEGQGRVLLIYQRYDGAPGPLLGQRFDPGGVRLGDVITIGSPMGLASVAGLPSGGWVVAYERSVTSVMSQAAVFRTVSPEGVLGPERRAGTVDLQERDARVAALGDGFVVTFDRQTMFEERLYARRFSATGTTLGPEVLVHAAMQVRWASIASEGEGDDLRWIATWQADFLSSNPRVEARRFRNDTALDGSPLVIAEGAFRPYAASARSPGTPADTSADRVRFLVAYEGDGLALQPVPMSPRASWPPAILFPASAPEGQDAFPTVVPRHGPGLAGAPPALVGFVSRYGHRDVSPGITATVALPTDAVTRLEDAFDLGLAEDGLALAASPRGTWIAWIESGFDGALRLFLLPN